jgi:hypothetical protein
LLKEIIDGNLGVPSVVSLERNKHGKFDLILRGECDTSGIRQFVIQRNLTFREDKEKGYCTIFKP